MTISEVSKTYNLSQNTLRYYERIGLIPPVPRNASGFRDYDDYSCGWVEFAHCMREAGVSVEALLEYIKLFVEGVSTKDARKQILIDECDALDKRIQLMLATKNRLEYKISVYDELNKNMEKLRNDEGGNKYGIQTV